MREDHDGVVVKGASDRRALLAGIGGLAAGTFLATGRADAGPLNPQGAPSSTGKTLSEVEPRIPIPSNSVRGDADSVYKITQPGSYYLTESITGVTGRSGIEIAADNVTIDLMGFEIRGVPGAVDGITDGGVTRSNISIINGTIRDWPESGVRLASTSGGRLSDLTSRNNGQIGIWIGGGGIIARCVVMGNGNDGIAAGSESVVTECSSRDNENGGITTGTACVVSRCTAVSCNLGIAIGDSSVAVACVARDNDTHGLLAGNNSSVVDSVSSSNTSGGFNMGNNTRIDRCRASGNGTGIETLACSMITNCLAASNTSHGIVAATDCVVQGNMCRGNGTTDASAAGIRVTGGDCRIEGNTCIENPEGIRVVSAGNFIVRNICSGNTINWVFDANNVFGPIVDRRFPGSAAVSGNAALSTLDSTDPMANYTY